VNENGIDEINEEKNGHRNSESHCDENGRETFLILFDWEFHKLIKPLSPIDIGRIFIFVPP
jgi:hypothetical protein